MKHLKLAGASAAILAAALLLVATAGQDRAAAQTVQQVPSGTILLAMQCAQGFSKTNAVSTSIVRSWDCMTPVVLCPAPAAGWFGNRTPKLLAPVQIPTGGIRLRYQCSYQHSSIVPR
jgi:hypothetical protein